jgi:hypothetical protein
MEAISKSDREETSCKHVFHKACLERWKAEKNTCPMCRHEIAVKRKTLVCMMSTTNPANLSAWELMDLVEQFANNLNVVHQEGIWRTHMELEY